MSAANAVATRPVKSAMAVLDSARDRISVFLPKGVSFDRIMGEVGLAVKENPKIAECTPESVVKNVIRALRMDLEIGIEYHLVPFSEKGKLVCTGIPGYRGLANLAVRCGAARSVQAHVVYEGDQFEMVHGLDPILRHVKVSDAKKRGAMLGAYYLIELPRGHSLFDFIPLADIEEVRKKSKQWNPTLVPQCPPWWARKRAVLVGLSLVPKNVRFANALATVAQLDDDETDDQPAAPAVPVEADDRPGTVDADGVEISDDTDEGILAEDAELLRAEAMEPRDLKEG